MSGDIIKIERNVVADLSRDPIPADESIQQMLDQVYDKRFTIIQVIHFYLNLNKYFFQLKDTIHSKSGKQFSYLKAVSYKTQIVNGTNYFIKVDAGSEHIHLRVYKPFAFKGDQTELHGVQLGKTLQDEVAHF